MAIPMNYLVSDGKISTSSLVHKIVISTNQHRARMYGSVLSLFLRIVWMKRSVDCSCIFTKIHTPHRLFWKICLIGINFQSIHYISIRKFVGMIDSILAIKKCKIICHIFEVSCINIRNHVFI